MTPLETLQLRRHQADEYSRANHLERWGFLVAWLVLSENVAFARSVCSRYNLESPAWKCYQNLLNAGLIVEGPEGGIVYDEMPKWEEGEGPLRWIEAVAHVAAGGEPDPDLPRNM